MAQRRTRRRSRIKKKAFSLGSRLFPVAKALAPIVSFVEQISAKHRQSMGSAFTNAPTTQKLKILTNIITGATTGINFFSDEIQVNQTLNPAGVLNKWTSNGAIMLVYSVLGKNINKVANMTVAPHTGKIGSIGKGLITGGAIGGFFDDPINTSHSNTGTRSFSQPVLQVNSGFRSSGSGSDSTESG